MGDRDKSSWASAVCVITDTRGFGGAEIHTLGLIDAISSRGVGVELIECGHDAYGRHISDRGLLDRVRVIRTDLSAGLLDEEKLTLTNWAVLWHAVVGDPRWNQLLGSIESKVCVFAKNNNVKGSLGFLAACRRRFKRFVTIEHLEAAPIPSRQSRLWFGVVPGFGLWWLKRRFVRSLGGFYPGRVVAVSGAVRDRLVGDWGYPVGKIVVIRNGVDWARFAREEFRGLRLRAALRIPAKAFVVGMSTRLSREKGIDLALKALRRFCDAEADAGTFLVIAGDGPDKEELLRSARDMGIEGKVRFMGFVEHMQDLYSAFDVILFASRVEGLPLGLLEAMAGGCVPVVTRVSGMPEAVDEADGGLVVEPEDVEGMARALGRIKGLTDQERACIGQRMADVVRSRFDIRNTYAALLTVLGVRGTSDR